MRVLQVSDGYRPATGGAERVVESLAKQLSARGFTSAVATLSRPDAPAYELVDGVAVHRLDGYTRHLRRFATDPGHFFHPTCPDPALVDALHRLVDTFRPDVVHAHGWILNSCLQLQLPPTTALVTTLHDYGLSCAKKTLISGELLDDPCQGPGLRRCLPCAANSYGTAKGAALVLALAESRRRLHRVSMFMPISSVVAAATLDGIPAEKITTIASFVDDEIFVDAAFTPPPAFLPEDDYIVFVGALGEHKGLALLAEAHRRMQTKVPLVVIGSMRADTPALTGTPDRPVIVRTGVPHADIMASFAWAAAAVIPSRWQEPLGLTAIEAMAAGTPVVSTRVGALPEVVADRETGLIVEPNDPAALAAALDSLLADPVLRARYGDAGLVRARAFTASATVPCIIDAYTRALELRSGGTAGQLPALRTNAVA